jgi:geranylgeranyl pyrophosphate synthase
MAILAGDALLTGRSRWWRATPARRRAPCAADLAHAAGIAGMVNGQADLLGEGRPRPRSASAGSTLGRRPPFRAPPAAGRAARPRRCRAAAGYEAIGLAFQVVDDLLGKAEIRSGRWPVGKATSGAS